MSSKSFSIKEALSFGFESTKRHFLSLAALMLVVGVLQLLVAISVEKNDVLRLIAQIFVVPGLSLAGVSVFFRVADGQKPEFSHLTERFSHYLRYVGTNVLYGLSVIVGFVLFIIPGIYLAIRLMFALTVVAEKNLKPMEAFHVSGILTKGIILKLMGLQFVLGLLNLVGVLMLGVGLLFTIPMTGIALLFVYKKLSLERLSSFVIPPQPPVLGGAA